MGTQDILSELRKKVQEKWKSADNDESSCYDETESNIYYGKECAFEEVLDLIDELIVNNGEWRVKTK